MNQLLNISELNSIIFIKEQKNSLKNRFNTFSFEEDFDVVKESVQYFRSDRVIPIQFYSKSLDNRVEVYNNGNLVETIIPEQKSDNFNNEILLDSTVEYLDEDRYLVTFSEGLIYNETRDNNGVVEYLNFDVLGTTTDLTGGFTGDYLSFFFGPGATATVTGVTNGADNVTISESDLHVLKKEFDFQKNYPQDYMDYINNIVPNAALAYPTGFGTMAFYHPSVVNKTSDNTRFYSLNTSYIRMYLDGPKSIVDLENQKFNQESYLYGLMPDFLVANENSISLILAGLDVSVEDYSYSKVHNKYGLVFRNSYDVTGEYISKITYNKEEYNVFEFDVSFLDKQNVIVKIAALENDVEKEIMLSEKITVDDEVSLEELVYYRSDNKYLNYSTGIKHLINIPVEFAYDKLSNESESEKDDDSLELISSDVGVGRVYELKDVSQAFARKLNLAIHTKNLFINNVPFVVESFTSEIQKESNQCFVQFSANEAASEPVTDAFEKEAPDYIALSTEGGDLIDLDGYLF